MKLDFMIKFFNHIAEREVSHGIEQAFRFKAVLSSRKNGALQPSRYKDFGIESGENEEMTHAPARKRRPVPNSRSDTPVPSNPPSDARSDTPVPSNAAVTPLDPTSGHTPVDPPAPLVPTKTLEPTPDMHLESTSGLYTPVEKPPPPVNIKPRPKYRQPVPSDTPDLTIPQISTSGLPTPADSPAPLVQKPAPIRRSQRIAKPSDTPDLTAPLPSTSGLPTPADSPAPGVQKPAPIRRSQRIVPVPSTITTQKLATKRK